MEVKNWAKGKGKRLSKTTDWIRLLGVLQGYQYYECLD